MPFQSLEMDQIDFDIIDLSTETDFTPNFCHGALVLVFETLFQSLEIWISSTKYLKQTLWAPLTIAELICCLLYGLVILFQSLEMPWSISWKTQWILLESKRSLKTICDAISESWNGPNRFWYHWFVHRNRFYSKCLSPQLLFVILCVHP